LRSHTTGDLSNLKKALPMQNDKPSDNDDHPADNNVSTQNEPDMQQNAAGPQDTGDSPEVQVKAEGTSGEADNSENLRTAANADTPKSSTRVQDPKWTELLAKFHNESNGLLAGKENLKIVATNVKAKPPFYRKWSLEANQVMRLTASLRRRLKSAKSKSAA